MKITEAQLLSKLKEFYDNGNYDEGLKLLYDNEDVIEKKYYEITKYKLLLLIQKSKYLEAKMLIKEELSVPYVPSDFEEFLLEKVKEVDFNLRSHKSMYSSDEIEDIDRLSNEQLLAILPELKKYNLNGYHNQFQNIFLNSSISDLTKSLLVACLSDVKLNQTFYVIKEETTIKFNPCDVFDIREGENYLFVNEQINKLNKVEINSLELIKRLTTTYLLNIYPLVISEHKCEIVLCACIELAGLMLNQPIVSDKYIEIYENNKVEVEKMCKKINILLESI